MSKRSAQKFSPREEKSETRLLLSGTLAGALAAFICTIALTLAASAIVLCTPDPDSLTSLAAYAVSALSLIVAGITAVRVSCGSVAACAAAGALYTLLAFCVHLVVTAKDGSSGALSLIFLAFPLISSLAGVLARPREKKHKHRFNV